jgi:hypothetical protein
MKPICHRKDAVLRAFSAPPQSAFLHVRGTIAYLIHYLFASLVELQTCIIWDVRIPIGSIGDPDLLMIHLVSLSASVLGSQVSLD